MVLRTQLHSWQSKQTCKLEISATNMLAVFPLNPFPFPELPITHGGFLNSLKQKIVEVPHFQTSRTCMPWPSKLHQNQKSMWTCQRREMGALKRFSETQGNQQRPISPISGEWDGTFFGSVDLFGVDPVDPWSFLVFDDFVDLSLCRFRGNLLQRLISGFNASGSGDVPKPRAVVAQIVRDNNSKHRTETCYTVYNHKKCNQPSAREPLTRLAIFFRKADDAREVLLVRECSIYRLEGDAWKYLKAEEFKCEVRKEGDESKTHELEHCHELWNKQPTGIGNWIHLTLLDIQIWETISSVYIIFTSRFPPLHSILSNENLPIASFFKIMFPCCFLSSWCDEKVTNLPLLGVLQEKSLWVVVWVYLSQNQESLKSPQTSFGCLQTRFRLLALPREFIHHFFFNQPRLPSWEGCERCKLCTAALQLKWWKKTCHVQSSHWL